MRSGDIPSAPPASATTRRAGVSAGSRRTQLASRWATRRRAFARVPRLVRFALVGGCGSLLELAALAGLVTLGVDKGVANAAALIALAQLHFFASREVTWAERRVPGEAPRQTFGRLVRFDGMMAASMLANQLTFELTVSHAPYLVAGALGIAIASLINYLVADRLVFRGAAMT